MNELMKVLAMLDKLSAIYAELEKAKQKGVEDISIYTALELVNLLGHAYAELAAYKTVEALEEEQTILH